MSYTFFAAMGYFFRKSVGLGPFRLNFSKSGVGASVGVKGARLTMKPGGTTYITVGSHGFCYRETVAHGATLRPDASSVQPLVDTSTPRSSDGEIPTADVSDLVDSSCATLVQRLNERAHMFNPAWLAYASAVLMFVLGVGLQSDANSPTGLRHPLLGAGYPTLVALYGYPNSVVVSRPLAMITVRTALYNAANLGVVFVQDPCISAYSSVLDVLNDQKERPTLAKEEIKHLQPCVAPAAAAWSVRRYVAIDSKTEITVDQARDRFAGITRKETAPPRFETEKLTANSGRAAIKALSGSESWPVGDDALASIRDGDAEAVRAVTRQMYFSYGLMVVSLGMVVLGIIVHKNNTERRISRLFYELDETQQRRYGLVQESFSHLRNCHRLWRVEAQSATWDRKRNAGASSLIRRSSISVFTNCPPRVKTNVLVPCASLGHARLYFLPDTVLYWDGNAYGGIGYDDLKVEESTTRFIEDEGVPGDSTAVGRTWRYVNKNGGPDRRFNNNVELPVLLYGVLVFTSSTGLNIHINTSSSEKSRDFATSWKMVFAMPDKRSGDRRKTAQPQTDESSPKAKAQKLLGVAADASDADISAAYRRLAQSYHPDKVAGLAVEFRELADRRMKEINAAYQLLKAKA